MNSIFKRDSREILDQLPENIRINTTITSPPYFDMKNYGSKNQIGYGQSYQDYLNDLQQIFGDILKITEEDGTLWIIIDTFKRENQVVTLPFDLSDKLKEVGWMLQDVIIWKKDKTVPWSVNGFMQRKFEYILFFSKTPNFKSNKDQVRVYDTSQLKKWWVKYPERYNPKGKALDEVWEFPIPTQGSWGDEYIRHFCPLPKDMVATMIEISTDEEDTILDPFAGTGTVLSQSAYMNRNYIGFELNPDYIAMFQEYLERTFEERNREFQLLRHNNDQNLFETRILNLRSLKYAKVIIAKLDKELDFKDYKILVERIDFSSKSNKILKNKYLLIGNLEREKTSKIIDELISKPPLSKFGIEPIFEFSENLNLKKALFGYTKTNTHSFAKNTNLASPKIRVISNISVDLNENDYS